MTKNNTPTGLPGKLPHQTSALCSWEEGTSLPWALVTRGQTPSRSTFRIHTAYMVQKHLQQNVLSYQCLQKTGLGVRPKFPLNSLLTPTSNNSHRWSSQKHEVMAESHKTQKESRLQHTKAKLNIKDSWLIKTTDVRIIRAYKISMTIMF